MFVLNKKTGLTWDVEGELLERLLKLDDYEKVKIKDQLEKPNQSPKKTVKKK
ncbi:hypothetical protein [Neobacillus sp. PS3-40]|uniref:hypothetical protein n=1 Tax=Neobacillus sp. PS3-40 TaxID=3070679 RepID=UPI0027E06CB3|nr:hypothetical protein [Neobacillus sp. PS3-40]WML44084.1 hypothetical protein RCG20_20260 [Neobacillus sp. PS3-40]